MLPLVPAECGPWLIIGSTVAYGQSSNPSQPLKQSNGWRTFTRKLRRGAGAGPVWGNLKPTRILGR
jgi:hypothetical protein